MKSKTAISFIALVAAVSMLTGCSDPDADGAVNVTVGEFGMHEIASSVMVSGKIENGSDTPYVISTNIESYSIKKLNVRVGDLVKAGDIICEFDTEDLKKQIAEKESMISSNSELDSKTIEDLKIQLASQEEIQRIRLDRINENKNVNQQKYDDARQKYDNANQNFNNADNSYNDAEYNLRNSSNEEDNSYYYNLCSAYQAQITQYSSEMEQYKAAMDSAQEALSSCEYEYEITRIQTDREISDLKYRIDSYRSETETKEELKKLNEQLENSVIRSEHDGIVEKVNVSEGQVSSEKNLVSVIDNSNKIVHVVLNDIDMLSVKEGMKASVTTASGSAGMIEGTVSKISKVKGDQGFDVYIQCPDMDALYIGMNVSVNIIIFSDEVDSVPKQAVKSDSESNEKYVFAAVEAGDGTYRLEKREVKTGTESKDFSQITDGELKAGDKVVISSKDTLQDGLNVTVTIES